MASEAKRPSKESEKCFSQNKATNYNRYRGWPLKEANFKNVWATTVDDWNDLDEQIKIRRGDIHCRDKPIPLARVEKELKRSLRKQKKTEKSI